MFEPKAIPLGTPTRAAVLRMLAATGDRRNLEAIVDEALQLWLQKTACDDPAAAQAGARGYQWKSLFLAEGTLLRFDYRGRTYHADVRGDRIVFEGRPYSPRQLLLHVTGTVRNAWRDLWIRGPGDFRWHLADTRRRILRRTPRPDAPAVKQAPSPYRSFLHRDDIVRDDQPDLSYNRNGGGWAMAGRSGKRDRRACNGFVTMGMAPRTEGKDAAQIALLRAPRPDPAHPAFRTDQGLLRPSATRGVANRGLRP